MNQIFNQQHFTMETPHLLQQIQNRDISYAKKLLGLLCNSSEIQLPNLKKMKLSDLMDQMQKPKNIFQQCSDLIYEIFLTMDIQISVNSLLDHFDSGHQCVNVLTLFYRLIPHIKPFILEEGYYSELIEKFEQALQVPNSLYLKLAKLTHDGDFHTNLTKFLLQHYPNYSKDAVIKERSSIPEKSASLVEQPKTKYKIPPLKLPTNLEGVGVMTRSTRRADPFKSFSTNSNRFSHSIDSGIKFTSGSQALHLKTAEQNQSVEEVSFEKKKLSAKETLLDLANQMGSCCLSQDLPCLLSKQRRQQLESLTKLGLSTIPTILKDMDEPITDSMETQDFNRIAKNRVCRLWGNIIYQMAKDNKQLQYDICPSNSILNYISSPHYFKNNPQNRILNTRKTPQEFDCDRYVLRNNMLCEVGQKQQVKENSLIQESQIYFMILDLYNGERTHLKLCENRDNLSDYAESERSVESPNTVVNIPELMLPLKSTYDQMLSNYRHCKVLDPTNLNPFLKQFQIKFQFILSNFDMNKSAYYEFEAEQLRLLDNYLNVTNNRIKLPQFLDIMMDVILMIKRQILDYTHSQLQQGRTPHPSHYQSKSAKHYSQTINNMFKYHDTSPQEEQKIKFDNKSQRQPFVQKHPNILSLLLSIIARLQLQVVNGESIKFFLQVFVNETFLEIVKGFTNYLLNEFSTSKEEGLEIHAMRVLYYYESCLIMLFQKQEKEYKVYLRRINYYLTILIKSISKFIDCHTYLINNKQNLARIQIYRKVFQLVGLYFSFDNNRISDEISSFYIRYCYVNFIKLYSQSNLNDLREINQKINEYHSNKIQQPSSKQDERNHKQWNVVFLNLFIKCLFQISSNRSEEISRKFYQYRIVEFLTREIDLEFDITQIKSAKEPSQKSSPRSNNSSLLEEVSERLSSKVSDRIQPPKLNLEKLQKQDLEQIIEEDDAQSIKKPNPKISQNLLKKVLIPKLDLDGKKADSQISQSYSHSPQFNASNKLQNLTALFKNSPQEQELNHKRGNSMPFEKLQNNIQLSESQRMLLQKNLQTDKKTSAIPKLNLKSCDQQQQQIKLNLKQEISEDVFYFSERKLRKLYQDEDLHGNCLALLLSLLIKPSRGCLDDLYCSQHPIINGKPNILFLLHHHLNHLQNQKIVPRVLQRLSELKAYSVGQRLLKLLCIQMFDISKYTDWHKLANGAYGVIYQCKSGLDDPELVAIKQMSVPKSIYERCVLHGLFTEITCMETFRLCQNVATLYDYGVTQTDYIIVMKRYPISLKEWRMQQKGGLNENLATYLSIYRDVLQAVQILHQQSITHYDIKADNILLDFNANSKDMNIVITDFGESKIFNGEEDEYCLRNRGTEYIKSPEMLTLTINSKKEQDTYDRRKKVGTTRSSDIWSIGCLLYEILTGELLFFQEWVEFYLQVTQTTKPLISDDKQKQLQNNIYIIDFLKYVLVRDQKHRPNIESVLKRFEHVHALLVTNTNPNTSNQNYYSHNNMNQKTFEIQLEEYHRSIYFDEKKYNNQNLLIRPELIKVTSEIMIADRNYFNQNQDKMISLGITNIIADTCNLKPSELSKFQYVLFSIENLQQISSHIKAAQLMPHMLDYIKQVLLHRGKLLIVENQFSYLTQSLLLCLSYFFKLNLYETYHVINSQTIYIKFNNMFELSQLSNLQLQLNNHLQTYPKLQCICGCSTLILKRDYNDEKKVPIVQCKCHGNNLCNGGAGLTKGCASYLKFLRKRYKLSWDSIKWGYIDLDHFLIGPFNRGLIRSESKIQILLSSMGPNYNLISIQGTDVYECKICKMWIFAHNRQTNETSTVMNNLLRKNRQGISQKIPILKNFNLYELK